MDACGVERVVNIAMQTGEAALARLRRKVYRENALKLLPVLRGGRSAWDPSRVFPSDLYPSPCGSDRDGKPPLLLSCNPHGFRLAHCPRHD